MISQWPQSAEYVKYAKIFGNYFLADFYTYWRSWRPFLPDFMPTEDLGNPFLKILCLLKILVTHSCRFYAYWRSWESMATHSYCIHSCFIPIFKKYWSCYVLKKIMQGFTSLGTYETWLIWNGMIIWNAVRKLITSFWKKNKIVD